MSDKHARKFDKLLASHREARLVRKRAAAARRNIKGLDGRLSNLRVLASPASAKAVEAELDALKVERRALKKLFAFAVKHAAGKGGSAPVQRDEGKTAKPGAGETKPAKGKVAQAKRNAKASSADSDPKG
jgi:hypothetical protein